ncbi:50S ribosomal subunit protein L33 [Candidatus Tremblaya phenacola PAVE]|nr:50S ribosomal subunit protein L33 [Candidatus Tremblaya phenacola PAVE]
MSKKKKEVVRLVSSSGSCHFYTVLRNRSNAKKLSLMKYDPAVKKHLLYIEKKGG